MSLEKKVRDIIETTTCSKYVGRIEVDHFDGIYSLRIGMDGKSVLICLGYEGDEDGFLKYVESEMINRKPQWRMHTKTVLVDKKAPDPSPVIEL